MAGKAEQRGAAADDVVLALIAEDQVVAAVALDIIVAVSRTVARRIEEQGAVGPPDRRYGIGHGTVALDRIVAELAEDHVVVGAAGDGVVAEGAGQRRVGMVE